MMVVNTSLLRLCGEWVIKLNNEEINKLKTRIAVISILRIFLFSLVVFIVILFLIDVVFQDVLATIVNNYSQRLYIYFKANKVFFMCITCVFVFCIASFFVIKNTGNSLALLIKSMDKILNNPQEEISLPDELSVLERRLNNIRVDLITSKNNEKEAIDKKNELIMYMAHDLKTPLTSVIGYLSLINDEHDISEEVRNKYIKIALDKAYRLEELTNQFFEITKYNLNEIPISKNKLDLEILLNQLVEECYPISKEKNIKIKLDTKTVSFFGDGDKLARAFTNLLKNAISYSFENSTIYVKMWLDKENINIRFRNKGERIPDYKLDKIFEKFYRADEARASNTGGSGLGLAITRDIITLHGGMISVSNKDEFIEFLVVLPSEKKAWWCTSFYVWNVNFLNLLLDFMFVINQYVLYFVWLCLIYLVDYYVNIYLERDDLMSNKYYIEIEHLIKKNEVNRQVRRLQNNSEDLDTKWDIGRLLVKAQGGEERAKYGDKLIKEWSKDFTKLYGSGYSLSNMKYYRQFYLTFEKSQALFGQLTWSHYLKLMPIKSENERNYYINLCLEQNLSTRELERVIKEKTYDRLIDKTS